MTIGECCVFRQALHDSRRSGRSGAAAILVWAPAEPSDWSSSGESQTWLVRPFSLIPWSPWRDFAQLVGGFKQSKKAPAPKVLERKTGRKNCKSAGTEKVWQLSWGWAQWRRLARCSRAASASPGTPSRSWARASSSARWGPSSSRSFGSWSSWRIWLVVEKYANSVYKSICDALTVKIGNFAMAPTVLQKRPHFAKVQNHHSSKNLLAISSSPSFVFVANNCATKYIWRNLT